MLLSYMASLHPHGRLPCWTPFFLHAISIYAVLLCFSISCPWPHSPRLSQGSSPDLFVYICSKRMLSCTSVSP